MAQGLTVDETHVVVTPAMYRSELYTALSRGRDANHGYAVCEADLPPRTTTTANHPRRPKCSLGSLNANGPTGPPTAFSAKQCSTPNNPM